MRRRDALALVALTIATPAPARHHGACYLTTHSAGRWVKSLDRGGAIVVDAIVVREQDADRSIAAELRPITVYKGPAPPRIIMAPPPATMIDHAYSGFGDKVGTMLFLILHPSSNGYRWFPCEYELYQPENKRRLLRNLAANRLSPGDGAGSEGDHTLGGRDTG